MGLCRALTWFCCSGRMHSSFCLFDRAQLLAGRACRGQAQQRPTMWPGSPVVVGLRAAGSGRVERGRLQLGTAFAPSLGIPGMPKRGDGHIRPQQQTMPDAALMGSRAPAIRFRMRCLPKAWSSPQDAVDHLESQGGLAGHGSIAS